MATKNILLLSIIGLVFFSLTVSGEPFFQDNTDGHMKKLNYELKQEKEKAWSSLSTQLQEMSNAIISNKNISKSKINELEKLWVQRIELLDKTMNKQYNTAIKDLSIDGAKGDFNDPLYYNEIRQIKRMYDIYYFIINKMQKCQYQIYHGFWEYPIKQFIEYRQFQDFGNTQKCYFLLDLISDYANRPVTEQNILTVELFASYTLAFSASVPRAKRQVTKSFVFLYKHTDDKKLKDLIRSKLAEWVKSDTSLQQEVQEILSDKK